MHLVPIISTENYSYVRTCFCGLLGGGEVLSKEGTTQGDPLGMAMFSLSMVPLITKLMEKAEATFQVWFADDAIGVGTLVNLKQWWSSISTIGPLFGYHPNAAKTCHAMNKKRRLRKILMVQGLTSLQKARSIWGLL